MVRSFTVVHVNRPYDSRKHRLDFTYKDPSNSPPQPHRHNGLTLPLYAPPPPHSVTAHSRPSPHLSSSSPHTYEPPHPDPVSPHGPMMSGSASEPTSAHGYERPMRYDSPEFGIPQHSASTDLSCMGEQYGDTELPNEAEINSMSVTELRSAMLSIVRSYSRRQSVDSNIHGSTSPERRPGTDSRMGIDLLLNASAVAQESASASCGGLPPIPHLSKVGEIGSVDTTRSLSAYKIGGVQQRRRMTSFSQHTDSGSPPPVVSPTRSHPGASQFSQSPPELPQALPEMYKQQPPHSHPQPQPQHQLPPQQPPVYRQAAYTYHPYMLQPLHNSKPIAPAEGRALAPSKPKFNYAFLETKRPRGPSSRWTADEDELLKRAVARFGEERQWVKVAQEVPGRTNLQCRQRWLCNIKAQVAKESRNGLGSSDNGTSQAK